MDVQPERTKPVVLVVDANAEAVDEVGRRLRSRYGADYRIVCVGTVAEGLRTLEALTAADEDLAVVLADQRVAGPDDAALLARVRQAFPAARRALLVPWRAWGTRADAGGIRRALALGRIDSYVLKPWAIPAGAAAGPDERFYRAMAELLYEWARARRVGAAEVQLVGDPRAPRCHELLDLLQRNGLAYAFHAADSAAGTALRAGAGAAARLPVAVLADGQVLSDPSNTAFAEALGVATRPERRVYEVVVVGAGPTGLSAAVYGASEGLDTVVVEPEAVGGQAGSSSLIRNYLGFSRGVGGAELAQQAFQQAWAFGASFLFMRRASALHRAGRELVVTLDGGEAVAGRAVVVATGVAYRRLGVPALEALTGAGVFYGAAAAEAPALAGQAVYVIGGGNSAGQAALYLARYAARVTLLVRGDALAASMSAYLIQALTAADNVTIRLRTAVVGGGGEAWLERLVLADAVGREETVPAAALFVLIGAQPRTDWLPAALARDPGGYVLTGNDLPRGGRPPAGWLLGRAPLPLETSLPGVFAAGDVRHGSAKRVAAGVGEGSIAIQSVHRYLTDAGTSGAPEGAGAGAPAPGANERPTGGGSGEHHSRP
jgi:thioredoxin reductase (NADPH)